MKLETFATLDAVLRTGSLAAAAVQMNLTPSAVSMQMKQLERYLGQPLFDRSGPKLRPRPGAFDAMAAMRDGLRRIDALRHLPAVTVEGTLRLGVIEALMPAMLPGALRHLRERHPRLSIRPSRGRSAGLIAAVKAGQLDAAVAAIPPRGGSQQLDWQLLARPELLLIAPPDTTETRPEVLLRRHEWIRYDRGSVTGTMAARVVRSLVPDKRSTLEVDSAPAIIAMVSAGLGVSVIHLLDTRLRTIYPVRALRLGRNAPVVKIAMVTRKDSDERGLAAVHEALAAQFSPAQDATVLV